MRGEGRDGRGNLRENREDPAPTVGIAIRIAPKGRPLPPPPCAYHASHLWDPMVFTTMRHVASLRSSNNCKCLIETFFIARGESPLHKRLNPYGLFPRFPFWNTAV